MNELVFEVTKRLTEAFCAECLTENIFTEAHNWDELRKSVVRPLVNSSSMQRCLSESAFTSFGTKFCPLRKIPRDVSGAHWCNVLCRRIRF